MGIDSLEETESNPDVDGEDMQVTAEHSVEDRPEDGTGTQDEDLSGVSILGSKTEGSRILVVDLVDVLVQRSPVKSLVGWTEKRCRVTDVKRTQ